MLVRAGPFDGQVAGVVWASLLSSPSATNSRLGCAATSTQLRASVGRLHHLADAPSAQRGTGDDSGLAHSDVMVLSQFESFTMIANCCSTCMTRTIRTTRNTLSCCSGRAKPGAILPTGDDEANNNNSRRETLAGLVGMLSIASSSSTAAIAEDATGLDVEKKPETRRLVLRAERAVAILDDGGNAIANGILWDGQGTVVSSYITFKDLLRKQARLTAKAAFGSLGNLTTLGFSPTADIIVFRSDVVPDKAALGPPIKIVTRNYVVGQTVLHLVRDNEGVAVGSGIVSGLDRTIIMANGTKSKGLLQTDAPIGVTSAGAGAWTDGGHLLGIITPGNIPFANFRTDSGVNFIQTSRELAIQVPQLLMNNSK